MYRKKFRSSYQKSYDGSSTAPYSNARQGVTRTDGPHRDRIFRKTPFVTLSLSLSYGTPKGTAPERRCSSRTFRYGYLVTT